MYEILDKVKLDKDNELWIIKKYNPKFHEAGYTVEGMQRCTLFWFFSFWANNSLGSIYETDYGFAYNLFDTFQEAVIFANDFKLKYRSK